MYVYDFDQQMRQGDEGADFLDAFFAGKGYAIRPATRDEQRQGVDRIFTSPRTGSISRVEYKTDRAAARTGNAFIETVSVDAAGKMGWALTSQADILVYYVPPDRRIYVVPFRALHWEMPRWLREYPPRTAQNDGYATHGIIIPLRELARHAIRIYQVGEGSAGESKGDAAEDADFTG
jgi:hypothetical protein